MFLRSEGPTFFQIRVHFFGWGRNQKIFSESILEKDVLIIDKSLSPKNNQLAVIAKEGAFQITRIDTNSKEEIQLWGVITYIIKSTL